MRKETFGITTKGIAACILLLAVFAAALLAGGAACADPVPDAEWTVLIYLCGSDLESRNGMASYNLHEIMSASQPSQTVRVNYETESIDTVPIDPEVNVVIETGGAKKWWNDGENASWGLNIANDRLQRYELSHQQSEAGYYPLILQEEQPLANMSEPETLAEFIRWGTERYPANRTLLVLWDHGNGSLGLIYDELFDTGMMRLDELENALADGGTHFDAILLDACMMGNLAAARAVAPYTDFLIASEEMVSGHGTAFRQWVSELFGNPMCDGERISCAIVEMTQDKYAAMADAHAVLQLTWSVIETKFVPAISEAFNDLMQYLCDVYKYAPEMLPDTLKYLSKEKDRLGVGERFMLDLDAEAGNEQAVATIDRNVINKLDIALDQAVMIMVNGDLHSNLCGLSVCVPTNLTAEQKDQYALVCPSAHYLSLLDAVLPEWEAPDWVYEQVERLTPVEEIPYLSMEPEIIFEDGVPKIKGDVDDGALWGCTYELYMVDEDTGDYCRIGKDIANFVWVDKENGVYEYTMDRPEKWPSIDGIVCDIEYVLSFDQGEYDMTKDNILLFDIPILLGNDQVNLRIGYLQYEDTEGEEEPKNEIYVYGISSGYNVNTGAPERATRALSSVQGQDFRLLYPIYTPEDTGRTLYEPGRLNTVYRGIQVEETDLPPGRYACSFVLESYLFRKSRTKTVEFYWDGKEFSPEQ